MHRHAVPDVHRLALWADQLPTAGAMDVCRVQLFIQLPQWRLGFASQSRSSLPQAVALSLKRQQLRAVHQPIQNGRAHGAVAQVFASVFDDSIGRHHDGAARFVAAMNHRLQQLGSPVGDAPGQKQIIKHQQVWLQHRGQQFALFFW